MYQKYYSKFLAANPKTIHLTAHSHHYWPDVTLDAVIEYWMLSANMTDKKWNVILNQKVPEVQKQIAQRLNFSKPENICFAPNTHDLLLRILSCLDIRKNKKISILTTDSEFYSFQRQILILEKNHLIDVHVISQKPFSDFSQRLITELNQNNYDMLFISHVFFNSGLILENLAELVASTQLKKTIFVLDAYHSFMALPFDLKPYQNDLFYIAGSYKYAQAGEGCCFMTVPDGTKLKPLVSGWFAGFTDLENTEGTVSYPSDGYRFAGSTMDYSTLFKLNAVFKLFDDKNISITEIHTYIQKLQKIFLKELKKNNHPYLNEKYLILHDLNHHGHFFAFELPSVEICLQIKSHLEKNGILTDSRGSVLRFGFGLYLDQNFSLKIE